MIKGAIISDCGKHRYRLWRIWNTQKPLCFFLLHNPSTANGIDDDPTIRRCMGFANSWGYGGIYVGNLFSFRATDPKQLLNKPILEIAPYENIQHIMEMISMSNEHILAYGNPISKTYKVPLHDWNCLKVTSLGNPSHPLYLRSDLTPIKYEG